MLRAKYRLDLHSPPNQRIQYVLSVNNIVVFGIFSERDQGCVNLRGDSSSRGAGFVCVVCDVRVRCSFLHYLIPDNPRLICEQRHPLSLQ